MSIIDKGLDMGFGLLSLGKKRTDLLVKDLRKHYDLNESQAKKLAKDLSQHANDSKKEIKKLVEENFKVLAKEAGLTKNDLAKLKGSVCGKKCTGKKPTTKKKPKRKKK